MPTLLVVHLHFLPTQKPNKKMQKSYQANAPKTAVIMDRHSTTERTPACNSTYPKGGVSCSKDSFVVNQTLVFQIKFCGKSPALRQAPKRYSHHFYLTGFFCSLSAKIK